MNEDEKYVREQWVDVHYDGNRVLVKRPNGGHWILSGNINAKFERSHRLDAPAAWHSAREFTEARKKEIERAEMAIAWLQLAINKDVVIAAEIQVHEQERLSELRRGWKRIV